MEPKVFGDLVTCTLLDLTSPNYGMNQQTKTNKIRMKLKYLKSDLWDPL